MDHTPRISYLCTQAAKEVITDDELTELHGYAVLDPRIWRMIEIEKAMYQIGKEQRE